MPQRGREVGPRVGERLTVPAAIHGVQLAARVGHEEVVQPVARVVARGDPHAGVRVVHRLGAPPLHETEPEPTRVRGRAAGPRLVEVQAIRIQVVRDVEVEPAVVVHVGEDGAEAVVEAPRLQPRGAADLTERRMCARAALVEVEGVPHRAVVGREARLRRRDGMVDVRVAGDEQVEPAVAVDVADGGAGVPAGLVDPGRLRALGERAVAVVPEERVVGVACDVVARGRHEQVGRPVAVEVRCDAAAPAHGEAGARRGGDVLEPALHVVEQAASRKAPVGVVAGDVRLRVRVDHVQVEPPVAVVVEPAEAAAHHRLSCRRTSRTGTPRAGSRGRRSRRRRSAGSDAFAAATAAGAASVAPRTPETR